MSLSCGSSREATIITGGAENRCLVDASAYAYAHDLALSRGSQGAGRTTDGVDELC